MNKFDRQSSSADIQALPDDIAEELSRLPSEVLSVDDAPSLAPPAPLSQDEVRTIVISLMLTMFLAALDQTIVATALPTIGRQFHDVSNLSWVITAYLLASTDLFRLSACLCAVMIPIVWFTRRPNAPSGPIAAD